MKKKSPETTEDKDSDLELADRMAVERTKLSNERTFLSYLRTSLALLAGGLTIIRLEVLEKVYDIGMTCLALSPLIMAFAIYRFSYNRRRFNKFFHKNNLSNKH